VRQSESHDILCAHTSSEPRSACFDQKSNCALIFANRADSTDVGINHVPPAMKDWL
jgi:hypothetical protein